MSRSRTPLFAAFLVFLTLLPARLPAADSPGSSPWTLLEELREGLQRTGPLTARFVQTYVPAGFSAGDQETGYLSMWLPDCLRWNYEEPQKKSFLLCKGEVYFWNEDEPGGRKYRIEPEKEPGLDLLLVDVDTLRERYVATSERQADGTYEISLALPRGEEGTFSARIHLDPVEQRVRGMEYTDNEGNLTRFEVSDYQRLAHTALFQPPSDIEWTVE